MSETTIERVVVWFSAGVTSAVAAKMAVDRYRGILPVHLVNCDTGSEHEDNRRFMDDVAAWLGTELEIIRNERFTDTYAVYRSSGFIKGPHGAKCTHELKKLPRRQYERLATDLQVFGYDADEAARAIQFAANNPEVRAWFPLLEQGITKPMARQILMEAGIAEPVTYALGFNNANCLKTGCVKGGMGYWNHYRRVFPEAFERMAQLERGLGYAICRRETQVNGERVFLPVYLDELDPTAGNYNTEPAFQCSLFCGQYEGTQMTTHTPYKAALHPVTPSVYQNEYPDACWQSAAVQAIVVALAAGDSYRSLGRRLGVNRGWLHMVAHGRRPPTRRLARALGVVVERPEDTVQFSVRMTRAERGALLQRIAASGMTRREWLREMVE